MVQNCIHEDCRFQSFFKIIVIIRSFTHKATFQHLAAVQLRISAHPLPVMSMLLDVQGAKVSCQYPFRYGEIGEPGATAKS